ncbi:peptidylprolyl isomerase [Peribacillus sp. NPDC097675]|uniref:peptidylprolyl isomerase n=1 Tax=Peribacillus sp. NPDC097675 TaxID=3390618 RepID=UPI003D0081CC
MRKIVLILFVSILLTACNSNKSELSISELEVVPSKVQDAIDSESRLQLINEGEKTSYVVFQSKGKVITGLEEQGDTLKIKLNVPKEDDDVVIQHVYKLTFNGKPKVLLVLVNEETIPFDVVSGI